MNNLNIFKGLIHKPKHTLFKKIKLRDLMF